MALGQGDLSLLFKLRAQNEASPAIKATQADIARLTSTTSTQFNQMQAVTTTALGKVTQSLTQVSSHIPVVGTAISGVSSQLGTLTATATTSASSMGLIAGAAVLVTSALGGTLKALFDVTVQAAEFQGKMFDLSQQTGVSVETLSALEIVAKTTGGSIESISQALVIFQGKLADATDATSKTSKLFQDLGISTNNTEDALRQALIVLSQMPIGFTQTDTAAELFGRRGGKQVLAVLKEMHGDLDGAIERFRAMGILISTESAAAADKFNDQLALLGFQIRSITAIVGNEAMPTILSALTKISKAFEDNQSTITAWVNSTSDAAKGALIFADAVRAIGTQITGLSNLPVPGILRLLGSISGATGILTALQKLGTPEIGALSVPDLTTPLRESTATPGTVVDLSKASKAAKEAQQRANREIALALAELEEITRFNRIALERERELDLKTIEEWKEASITAAFEHLAKQQEIFEQERENARRFIKNRQDRSLTLREIEQKDVKAQNEFTLTLQKINDDARKRTEQAALSLKRQLAEIRDTAREGELQRIEDALDREEIFESEAIARRLALLQDARAQRLLLIDIELKQETTSAARKIELDKERIKSEQKFTDEKLRLTRERINAIGREAAAGHPGIAGVAPGSGAKEIDFFSDIGKTIEQQIGPPPEIPLNLLIANVVEAQGAFAGLGQAISGVLGLGETVGKVFGVTLRDVFGELAQAVGQAVYSFALFGKIEGGFRKFSAEVIAALAAQAATQAVFQAAQGVAWLALGWFTGNATYHKAGITALTSAAMFAAVAGVATGAARGLAGGVFGGSNGGGIGGGAGGSAGPLQTIETGRNQPQRIIIEQKPVTVRLVSDLGELRRVIVGHVVEDYNEGGPVRETIANDGR